MTADRKDDADSSRSTPTPASAPSPTSQAVTPKPISTLNVAKKDAGVGNAATAKIEQTDPRPASPVAPNPSPTVSAPGTGVSGATPVAPSASSRASAPSGTSPSRSSSPLGEKTEHTGEAGVGAEEVKPDFIEPAAPIGAQAQPALMTPQGSIDHGMVASPSGPVPASLIVDDDARKRALENTAAGASATPLDQFRARRAHKTGRRRIPDGLVDKMSPAEVTAVAVDRGYDIQEGGRRVKAARFKQLQDEDDSLDVSEDWETLHGRTYNGTERSDRTEEGRSERRGEAASGATVLTPELASRGGGATSRGGEARKEE